jgi:dUTP pyrophosphatase
MYTDNDVPVPKRQTKESAGYDFYMPYDLEMKPGVWYKIDTQVALNGREKPYMDCVVFKDGQPENIRIFPRQWFIQLMPKSSLGDEYGFKLANTIGVIDKDFIDHHITAKVMVDVPLTLKKGQRFMQGAIVPMCYDLFEEEPTATRNGGHGSTGTN